MSEDAELAARSTLLSADAFCQGEYDYIVIGAGWVADREWACWKGIEDDWQG